LAVHKVVSHEEWVAARKKHLAKEKEFTHTWTWSRRGATRPRAGRRPGCGGATSTTADVARVTAVIAAHKLAPAAAAI
jgi:hypothetical protein